MCCCGKPIVNGELGYRWQPNDAPSVREPQPPELAADETLLYDAPGRCGGVDSHSHHFRLAKWHSTYYLRVRHGGGEDVVPMRLYGNGLKEALAAMSDTARYWLFLELYNIHRDGQKKGGNDEREQWQTAAAEKRIKTRKQRNGNRVKVWIEESRTA